MLAARGAPTRAHRRPVLATLSHSRQATGRGASAALAKSEAHKYLILMRCAPCTPHLQCARLLRPWARPAGTASCPRARSNSPGACCLPGVPLRQPSACPAAAALTPAPPRSHADSLSEPGQRDHDRPISARGAADARAVARHLFTVEWLPDLLLCSNSRRTKQTVEAMSCEHAHFDDIDSHFFGTLYTVAALDGQTRGHIAERVRAAAARWCCCSARLRAAACCVWHAVYGCAS